MKGYKAIIKFDFQLISLILISFLKQQGDNMRNFLSYLLLTVILVVSQTAYAKKLKVYILAGQSNMEGHAHVRTFEHIGMDPKTVPLLDMMQDKDGKHTVCDRVWISYLTSGNKVLEGKLTTGFGAQKNGPKIGPEFTFGLTLEKKMDNPILIIKTAWGGKSLHTDFRSPSAGPFEWPEKTLENLKKKPEEYEKKKDAKKEATGKYYKMMIDHINKVLEDPKKVCPAYDAKDGYEIAGFVWFQGWNDMVDGGVYPNRYKKGGYDKYAETLTHFIRDVRKELNAPDMPFVIGVMGTGGPTKDYKSPRYKGVHQNFRDAMAAPAEMDEFKGNVHAVLTELCWDKQLGELDARWGKVKRKSRELNKDKSLSKEQRAKALEEFTKENFTEEEIKIRKVGISNFGFHYLGSGKVMAQIGKAFAEALTDNK